MCSMNRLKKRNHTSRGKNDLPTYGFCITNIWRRKQRVGNRYSNITSEIQFVKRFWARRDLCPPMHGTYVPVPNVPLCKSAYNSPIALKEMWYIFTKL